MTNNKMQRAKDGPSCHSEYEILKRSGTNLNITNNTTYFLHICVIIKVKFAIELRYVLPGI